jgi:DUF4097 and DUF4098 domain-containing protein YvlB
MRSVRMIPACMILFVFLGVSTALPEATEEFHKTCAVAEGTPVYVSNVSGKIDVSLWDKTEVDIAAVKRTKRDRSELEKVSIEVSTANGLTIKPVYSKGARESASFLSHLFGWGKNSSNHVSVDFTIMLPRAAVLCEAASVSGDISVSGVRGDAAIHTVSGNVRARDIEGMLELSSTSGNIEVERTALRKVNSVSGDATIRDVRGEMAIHSVSGDIRVEGAAGAVEASSTSGDINITAYAVRSASSVSGDVCISASSIPGPVELSTISGDIRFRVPVNTNADIAMHSVSGDLTNDSELPISALTITKRSMKGKIGAGGAAISMKTTSGDVTLE